MGQSPFSGTIYLSPGGGKAVIQVLTRYTARSGGGLMQEFKELDGSDLFGAAYRRFSPDHGRTWSPPQPVFRPVPLANGAWQRQGESALFLSPFTETLYRFYNFHREVGHPFSGKAWWKTDLCVERSLDGGKTFEPATQPPGRDGLPDGYCPEGISFCQPVALSGGAFLVPVQRARPVPGDADGALEWEAGCLIGREEGARIIWRRGGFVRLPPEQSTRGIFEPSIAPLRDGRLLMVCRGSNGRKTALPSRKWMAVSGDGGETWTPPRPFAFEDGEPFFSPSSGSTLFRHGSGRLCWFGNITPENAASNRPRYPLVMATVDESGLCLKRESVRLIDTRREGDSPNVQLSNFRLYEDRESGEIVLFLARLEERAAGDLTSPAYCYRVPPAVPSEAAQAIGRAPVPGGDTRN